MLVSGVGAAEYHLVRKKLGQLQGWAGEGQRRDRGRVGMDCCSQARRCSHQGFPSLRMSLCLHRLPHPEYISRLPHSCR